MDKITRALIALNKIGITERQESRELERLTTLAEGVGGQGFGGEPHGGGVSDRLASSAVRLSEYKDKIKKERRARLEIKAAALRLIWSELDAYTAYVAIEYAYAGKEVKEIARESGMSVSWCYRQISKITERSTK